MKKIVLVFFGLLFGVQNNSAAQEAYLYSGSYREVYFTNFVNDFESRYQVKFYYGPELDSVQFSLDFMNFQLKEVLDKITSQTDVNFKIKDNNTIVSSGGYQVNSKLPEGFYHIQNKTVAPQKSAAKSILDNIREFVESEKENKLENELITIGQPAQRYDRESASITGYIKDEQTGEPVIGASIYKKDPLVGAVTDTYGYYSFTLPKGNHTLFINSTGMKPTERHIILYSDGQLNVEIKTAVISLKEVVITGEENQIDRLQTGFAKLDMKSIRQIPSVMGEADIMNIALTLPGVQSVGEGAAGFNVRGGSADQNLVLLNGVPIYNTNHLFGFFSVFNPDVISSADLYKSGISANYGGRIASVFDVQLSDGNKKKFTVKGGISPVTGKLTVEGPIKKDTSSFILGVRSTYSDWLLSLLENPNLRGSTGAFSDVVGKVSHRIDDKNAFTFSAYHSRDDFRLGPDSTYRYFNSNAVLQWRHTFSSKLHSTSSVSFANYNYDLLSDENPANSFELDYSINHYSFQSGFNYLPKEHVNIKFGIESTLYQMQPGKMDPVGVESLIESVLIPKEKGLESAIYGAYEYDVNRQLSVSAGLRLSMFNRLGPGSNFNYQTGNPRETKFISDTTFYANNELVKTYVGPELRLSGRYKLKEDLSFKFSYDRMNQYIHVLSNTTSISPTDSWRLSGVNIKPQIGNQYSIGFYKTFLGTSLELSVESYFKKTKNVLEYKDGAELLLNEALETDILGAKGKSYGIELLLKKNSGKFTGWLSYTFSRSLLQAKGLHKSETINFGDYYPSNYDKPHSAVLISNFKLNRRVNISFNLNYSTGRPSTFPVTKYEIKEQPVLHYTRRNQYRIPHYFRMDLGVNFEGNHKVHKKIHGSWSFSVYNLTSRSNAYSVFFRSEEEEIKGYKMSIFKNAIPTITYHFQLK